MCELHVFGVCSATTTEYTPKRKPVKQVASVTETWCDVRQVTTALHSLPTRHIVCTVLSYQEEP